MGGGEGEVELSFQGHGHDERGSAHCHGHGHESRRPKSFWPMQGACAGSLTLSLQFTLPTAVPTALSLSLSLCSRFSGLMSFAARVRVDTLPAWRALFARVFVFCGCAKRESSMATGTEGGRAVLLANDVRA